MARYTHTIDAKGRVFVPARLREEVGRTLVITLNIDDGYLSGYTPERFADIRRQLEQLSGTDPAARRLRRAIIGEAMACELDSQGRISVSMELWSFIGVKPGDEICSKAFFDAQQAEQGSLSEVDLSGFDVRGL